MASARKVTEYLYNKPLINAGKVSDIAGISLPSAYSLIENLVRLGIVQEITGGHRKREYVFGEYIQLFQ